MPAHEASTSRRFLFAAPLVVLGSCVVSARATEPDYRGGLAGRQVAQAPAQGATAVKPAEKTIKMQKVKEPWPATLDWLAKETGMGISVPFYPTDNFTYVPGAKDAYTIPEVVDILNEQLMAQQPKPLVLIRGPRQWRLLPLPTNPANVNQRIDPSLLPLVNEDELKEHGETELVTLAYQLEVLSADHIATEYAKAVNNPFKKLMAVYGELIAIPGANQLVLRDSVANIKNVIHYLKAAEKAEKEKAGMYQHKCEWIRASEAAKNLKELLGVAPPAPMGPDGGRNPGMPPNLGQPGQGGAQEPKVHVAFDNGTNTVMVSGPPNKTEQAKRALEKWDVQKPGQAPIPTGPLESKTYRAPSGNADALVKSLKEFYKPGSDVGIAAVGKDAVMVSAYPADHAEIKKFIDSSKDELVTKQIVLNTLTPKQAVESLGVLFESKNNAPVPIITANPNENAIIVRGTPEQIKAVEVALESYGEKPNDNPASLTTRTITLEKGNATNLAQALATMIPKIRKNPINVIIPGSNPIRVGGPANDKTNQAPGENKGRGQLYDPQAPKPGESDMPINLTAFGNKLRVDCDDPAALGLVQELSRLLTQTQPGEGDFEVINLKTARAVDAAKILDEAFNGNKPQQRNDYNRFWFDPFMRNQPKPEGAIRVVADPSTNSLLVRATPLDMITIRKMVEEFIDNKQINKDLVVQRWKIGPFKYATAKDVYYLLKDVYKESLNNTLEMVQNGRLRDFWGPLPNLNTDPNGQPRGVELQLSYDDRTNSVWVACNAIIKKEIDKIIESYEKDAKELKPTIKVIQLKNIDPDTVQKAVDAFQGKAPRPSTTKPAGSTQQGLGGPQSRANDGKDDRQLASLHDTGGGPRFFGHGVKDDPKFAVLFDPQQAAESDQSSDNVQFVSYEQAQPAQPSTQPAQPPESPRGPVTAESFPSLGVIVIKGENPADVEAIAELIKYIEGLGAKAEIQIEVIPLLEADATSVTNILSQVYQRVNFGVSGNFLTPVGAPGVPRPPTPPQPQLQPQPGPGGVPQPTQQPTQQPQQPQQPTQQLPSIVLFALPRFNAILVAAPRLRMDDIKAEIKKLDKRSTPDAKAVAFPLKKASARTVWELLNRFYAERYPGEQAPQHQTRFTFEQTTNTVFVQAAPSDLKEISDLIEHIDTTFSKAVNGLRIVHLNNALALEIADLLTRAISEGVSTTGLPGQPTPGQPTPGQPTPGQPTPGQPTPGQPFPGQPTPGQPTPGQPTPGQPARPGAATKGLSLKFMSLESGVLEDIFITPDVRTNSLIISAPEKTMHLLEALIKELDGTPAYRADIKIFTLHTADAATMANLLYQLFFGGTPQAPRPVSPLPPTGTGGGPTGPTTTQQPTGPGGGPGGPAPLLVSEGAPLIQLRFSVDERTNSLIVAGSPNDIALVDAMIHRLEDTPVQNRINDVYHLRNSSAADVANALSTFLYKSLSVLTQGGQLSPFLEIQRDVVVIPEPITNQLLISATQRHYPEVMRLIDLLDAAPAQVVIQVLIAEVHLTGSEEFGVEFGLQNPVLFRRSVGATTINTSIGGSAPGFNFNSTAPLPSNFAADPSIVGFQGLGNLGVGRASPTSAVGGFVFSAASDTFNLLIRALKTQGRIEILSRPQITTMDNQVAYVNVGQSVPYITGVTVTTGIVVPNVSYRDVGVILGVTPRISPDGRVLMRVVPEVSAVSPSTINIGNGVNATQFDVEHFETTISVQDGETVAVGGLITKRDTKNENKFPWLGDLPYVGTLFRYRTETKDRRELLVILTPHVVRSPLDADRILAEEARRMEWCVGDVISAHGTSGMAPILPPPPGSHAASLPGVSLDPALLPTCPAPVSSEPRLTAPAAQPTMPPPPSGPGPQSQRAPASGVQALTESQAAFQSAGPWKK